LHEAAGASRVVEVHMRDYDMTDVFAAPTTMLKHAENLMGAGIAANFDQGNLVCCFQHVAGGHFAAKQAAVNGNDSPLVFTCRNRPCHAEVSISRSLYNDQDESGTVEIYLIAVRHGLVTRQLMPAT
jgi:hypothetical protein